jgi:cytochrome oxidase Cu insertion factor (SCO1/SenC/PrrC family)
VSVRRPYRDPFVWAFLAGIALLTAIRPLLRRIPEPPPVTGHLPAVSLVDEAGHRLSPDDLRGRVYIAAPFWLPCAPPCSDVVAGMRQMQEAYRERAVDGVRLLSIVTAPDSVDTGRLAALATEAGATPPRWRFVTGAHEDLAKLATALTVPPDRGAKPFVIIDREGRLRGSYGADPMGLDEVYNRAQHVLREAGG